MHPLAPMVMAALCLGWVSSRAAAAAPLGATAETAPLFAKLDPRLRLAVADKTGPRMRVVAELAAPLPAARLARLQELGLRVLRAGPGAVHAEGDAQAVLALAACDEVRRVAASGPVRKSPSEGP